MQGCMTAPPPRYHQRRSVPTETVVAQPSIDGLKFPTTMLLIDEKNLGTIATAETETMGISRIKKRGGNVVDQSMVKANLKKNQTMLKAAGDNRGAASLGLQYGADVIIVGEAVAKPSARRIGDSNLRSYEAVVNLRAVRTDNSDLLASVSETSTIIALDDVSGSSKALKAAAAKSMDQLIPAMVIQYNSVPRGKAAAYAGNIVNLTVGGIDQLHKVKKVREKLKTLKGISSVSQKSYTAGIVIFDIVATKPTAELAEDIVIDAPAGLKMQALNVTPGKIEMRAVTSRKK